MHSPQVRELIDKVRAVFVETLDELRWMDEASKKKAQEKVGGWLEFQGQGFLPGEGSPSMGAQGDHRHTHIEINSPRLGMACSERGCGQKQDQKPSLGDPPAPLATDGGGHGLRAEGPLGQCDKRKASDSAQRSPHQTPGWLSGGRLASG